MCLNHVGGWFSKTQRDKKFDPGYWIKFLEPPCRRRSMEMFQDIARWRGWRHSAELEKTGIRASRSGTVTQRWWLEICSPTRTSITSLTQHHMLSSTKMVHVDARILCRVIFHGANAYIFIYFNSISRVIKMNVCLRILFMKKTQPKTKVACLCPSSSAVTKPQSRSALVMSNTTRYTSQLGLCGTL